MISLPPQLPDWKFPPDLTARDLKFKMAGIIDEAHRNLRKNMTREMQICVAAGVETETVVEGDKLVLRTVPKVAIADMGDGTIKVFVRYADESPQEAASARRPVGYRRGHVSEGYLSTI